MVVDQVAHCDRLPDVDKLNPDDARPPYQQVVEALRQAIESGRYKPGEKLPAHHVVVSDFGVSLGTVKRAYGELQTAGLIITRQGQGSFVRTRASATDPDHPDDSANVGVDVAALRAAVAALSDRVAAVERRLSEI